MNVAPDVSAWHDAAMRKRSTRAFRLAGYLSTLLSIPDNAKRLGWIISAGGGLIAAAGGYVAQLAIWKIALLIPSGFLIIFVTFRAYLSVADRLGWWGASERPSSPRRRATEPKKGLGLSLSLKEHPIVLYTEEDRKRLRKHEQDLDELRKKHGVRQVNELEEGKGLSDLPNGVYGQTSPYGGLTLHPKSRYEEWRLEVHKSAAGKVYLIGYTSKKEALAIESGRPPESISLFTKYWTEAQTLVAVPLDLLVMSSKDAARLERGGYRVDFRCRRHDD